MSVMKLISSANIMIGHTARLLYLSAINLIEVKYQHSGKNNSPSPHAFFITMSNATVIQMSIAPSRSLEFIRRLCYVSEDLLCLMFVIKMANGHDVLMQAVGDIVHHCVCVSC